MVRVMIIPYFIWAWLVVGLLGLSAAEWGPFNFILPRSAILLIEEAKLFFILIVLPLLTAPATKETPNASPRLPQVITAGLINFGMFILLFLPLTVTGALLGHVKFYPLFVEHLLLLFVWLAILAVKQKALLRWYYLMVFSLSGALPVVYYLAAELTGRSITIVLYFNPFWLVYRILL